MGGRQRSAAPCTNVEFVLGQANYLDRIGVGVAAYQAAEYEKAVSAFDGAADSSDAIVAATALFNKGVALGEMDRPEDELAAYDQVIGRFGDSPDRALAEQVAQALYNKGVRLGELGQHEDELAAYDEVIGRFGGSTQPALAERAAAALYNKGVRLGELGQHEDELAAYNQAIEQYALAASSHAEEMAHALLNKGATLVQLDRSEDAVVAYDEVIGRFGGSAQPALAELVAVALVSKGVTLDEMGRHQEAVTAYDQVAAQFGDSVNPALAKQVATALLSKGMTLGERQIVASALAKDPAMRPTARRLLALLTGARIFDDVSAVADAVLGETQAATETRGARQLGDNESLLTPTEAKIAALVARGLEANMTVEEIANNAGIMVGTIRSHLKSIYAKLGVHSQAAFVPEVRRRGLLG